LTKKSSFDNLASSFKKEERMTAFDIFLWVFIISVLLVFGYFIGNTTYENYANPKWRRYSLFPLAPNLFITLMFGGLAAFGVSHSTGQQNDAPWLFVMSAIAYPIGAMVSFMYNQFRGRFKLTERAAPDEEKPTPT